MLSFDDSCKVKDGNILQLDVYKQEIVHIFEDVNNFDENLLVTRNNKFLIMKYNFGMKNFMQLDIEESELRYISLGQENDNNKKPITVFAFNFSHNYKWLFVLTNQGLQQFSCEKNYELIEEYQELSSLAIPSDANPKTEPQ